jgi:hypothetical protein
MSTVAVFANAVAQLALNAKKVADELLEHLLPLSNSRHDLDLDVRHQMGGILKEGLYPSGQKRLPYGSQVMGDVSEGLGMARTDLHRMVKFHREFPTLAAFKAKHPGVTTWDGVKKVLATTGKAKANSSKRLPTDPALAIWKQIDKQKDALLASFALVPKGSKKEYAEERLPQFQAVSEKFKELLSTCSTDTQNSPVSEPSPKEGDTQQESVLPSSAQ